MIVDIHAHILTETFLSELADEGAFGIEHGENGAYVFLGYGPLDHWLYDIDARIKSLSARDIDLQLVAPPPRMVSHATWSADVEFARRLDRQTANAVALGAGLLGGLATPAFSEPARAAEELRRAVGEYGFKGVTRVHLDTITGPAIGPALSEAQFRFGKSFRFISIGELPTISGQQCRDEFILYVLRGNRCRNRATCSPESHLHRTLSRQAASAASTVSWTGKILSNRLILKISAIVSLRPAM